MKRSGGRFWRIIGGFLRVSETGRFGEGAAGHGCSGQQPRHPAPRPKKGRLVAAPPGYLNVLFDSRIRSVAACGEESEEHLDVEEVEEAVVVEVGCGVFT
jgi:hypothetical protein